MSDSILEEVIAIVRSSPIDFCEPPATTRPAFEALFAEAPQPDSLRYEAAEVGGVRGMWARLEQSAGDRAIIYLHGGGYVVGSSSSYAALAGALAETAGIDTFIVDYRLAPEHPYPAAPEDAFNVYRSMLSAGMKSITVVGDSAGGGLVMSLLLLARRNNLAMPSCGVLWSPWLNLACDTESYTRNAAVDPTLTKQGLQASARHYIGDSVPADEVVRPLEADLTGLPPLLIQVGSIECLLDDAAALAGNAAAANVLTRLDVYPGLPHVFQNFAGMLPQAARAFGDSIEFIHRAQADAAPAPDQTNISR